MKTEKISSWRELLDLIESTGGIYSIYRGVSDASYELIPKVGRDKTNKNGWSLESEMQILSQFKIRALPYLEHTPKENDLSDWLIIGQHHGLPTRLLDWTENPLAAAFFAVEWNDEETDAAIYIEDIPGGRVQSFIKNIFEITGVDFLYPPHIARRVTAQSGVFTVHPDPTSAYDSETMTKIVIPSNLRDEIQQKLDKFDINRASLFPDLDGISAQLAWRFRNYD